MAARKCGELPSPAADPDECAGALLSSTPVLAPRRLLQRNSCADARAASWSAGQAVWPGERSRRSWPGRIR